jgi:hypothetical protein
LVEGGHDIDIADLRVQISSAAVFLGLSRKWPLYTVDIFQLNCLFQCYYFYL